MFNDESGDGERSDDGEIEIEDDDFEPEWPSSESESSSGSSSDDNMLFSPDDSDNDDLNSDDLAVEVRNVESSQPCSGDDGQEEAAGFPCSGHS